MRLYLDDDSARSLLVKLLIRAGHDVQTPPDAGLNGTNLLLTKIESSRT